MALSASSFLGAIALDSEPAMALFRSKKPASDSSNAGKRPVALGTTFSPLQCHYMGLDYQAAFRAICGLGFNRLRLGSYWHEIEPVANQFNFTMLDWLLAESHRYGIEVVLTVGMKAPRWPEFHFPNWLRDRQDVTAKSQPLDHNPAIAEAALNFTQKVLDHTRQAPGLSYWQVENEPFLNMEITAGRYLSPEFVRQEVALVRSQALPHQKLLLTNAITLPVGFNEDDRAFEATLPLADAIGINVYTKVPIQNSAFYLQPLPPYWQKLRHWQQILTANGKEAWIAEAQAEPWEPNYLVALEKVAYPSASPERATKLVNSLTEIGYSTVMLWGCEYWYWHKQNGRSQWWRSIQELIGSESASLNQFPHG